MRSEAKKKLNSEVKGEHLVTRNFMAVRKVTISTEAKRGNPDNLMTKSESSKNYTSNSTLYKNSRKPINLTIKRELLNKAHHCCQYVDSVTGKKCESTYQLQIDHCVPLAKNGSHDINNLQVLCRTHNLLSAHKWGLL